MNQNADSTVTQDYLKAVWALEEWGGSASVTALAKRMQVANSTASGEIVSRRGGDGFAGASGRINRSPYLS